MRGFKNITVLIPCYNEEEGIGNVIESIQNGKLGRLGYRVRVLVIDNNSADKTIKIAKSKGARIIKEKRQGKGHALVTGFKNIPKKEDIVVMIDGDNTYRGEEIHRLVGLLDDDFCDVVVGTRLGGRMNNGSMSYFNRVGNWFFTFLVRVAYNTNVTDVCSGYFAWKKHVVDDLAENLKSGGFSIEMEMITKMAKMDYKIYSVPISYDNRLGDSKINSVVDGAEILLVWLRNLFWRR